MSRSLTIRRNLGEIFERRKREIIEISGLAVAIVSRIDHLQSPNFSTVNWTKVASVALLGYSAGFILGGRWYDHEHATAVIMPRDSERTRPHYIRNYTKRQWVDRTMLQLACGTVATGALMAKSGIS